MLRETMTEVDKTALQQTFIDRDTILNEYETTIISLKEELNICKLEQNKLHLEIENLRKEGQNANAAIQKYLAECNHGKCSDSTGDTEIQTNLEKQITVLQMEKDYYHQLWQMGLKAIDVLEDELKTVHKEDKSAKFYQEHIDNTKISYSEAIKILESKLETTKENFFQQQALYEKSKENIIQLTQEKNDLLQQLDICHQQAAEKEINLQVNINSLKENLTVAKIEFEQMKKSKIELEEKLKISQNMLSTMLSKEQEAKIKVAEAVAVVESAVQEKEAALKREVRLEEEKTKLETHLAKLSEEYTSRLEKEVIKAKEIYNKNLKKYSLEIKELKAELREKQIVLDRSERERRLTEEELENIRHRSDNYLQTSNVKILNLEHTLRERNFKLQNEDENCKAIYDDRIHELERQITYLQDKLANTTEKLRRMQIQNSRDVEDHLREADERTREMVEKCSNFERQLSRALMDKDNLNLNLKALEINLEKEMQKRNCDRIMLETKVRDLQENVSHSEGIKNCSRSSIDNPSLRKDTGQQTLLNLDSVSSILATQERYEKKTKELTQHVEAHQRLSNQWKEEANSLTAKFQKRSQELKNKINFLQKQNEELSKELLFYQQLLARCNTQLVQKCTGDIENR